MTASHNAIFFAGLLFAVSILAGRLSVRTGTPLLLVFLGIGMLAGEDGPGGILFDNFEAAYLVGSLALALILFEGGLTTERGMLRQAFWPAATMATVGVLVSAGIAGAAIVLIFGVSWAEALLLGAVMAPTDAAAVAVLLRSVKTGVPARIAAVLEIESGLNDPMSVFLTVALVQVLLQPGELTAGHAALLFVAEMGGGLAAGYGGGRALLWILRNVALEAAAVPVLVVGGALAIFGGAQSIGASGFLAVYIAGVIVGNTDAPAVRSVLGFFRALGWLAQIALFLMLGLLVAPHELIPLVPAALILAVVLIVVARPVSAIVCLLPFGFRLRPTAFVAWVGLRGAVPIYLTIIPVLSGASSASTLFGVVFVVVIASVAVQGWTIGLAARLLGLTSETG